MKMKDMLETNEANEANETNEANIDSEKNSEQLQYNKYMYVAIMCMVVAVALIIATIEVDMVFPVLYKIDPSKIIRNNIIKVIALIVCSIALFIKGIRKHIRKEMFKEQECNKR